ncbi:HNH endonuclease domain-containing protein [Metabacillus dongyingensis]|uniref:HNH endonuclease n=1 Tax=Metabacillus dongyingensis TaxID=2874282 RepID=UPI003B8E4712
MKKFIEVHKNGFMFDEMVVSHNRERYLLRGEIVGLQCTACKEAYGLDGFGVLKLGVAGKYNKCKGCHRKHTYKWSKENPEKVKANNKRWSDLRSGTPKQKALEHNCRATKEGLRASLTADMIEELTWSRQGKCWLSGRSDVPLEIDHVIPISRGGGSYLGNLILIDKRLNQMKFKQTLIEFLSRKDIQSMLDPLHVEQTLRTLANYNCMRVPAYELHVQHVAESADHKRRSQRPHLRLVKKEETLVLQTIKTR